MKCAIRLHPDLESWSLQYLRYYFNLQFNEEIKPHDAQSDILVLKALFVHLAEEVMNKNDITWDDAIQAMIRVSTYEYFLNGKHRGKTMYEVAKTDKSYFEWLLKEEKKKDTPDDAQIELYTKYLSI